VQVFEHEHDRRHDADRLERLEHLAEHALVRGAGKTALHRFELVVLDQPRHLGKPRRRLLGEQAHEPLRAGLAGEPSERFQHGQVRLACAAMFDALTARNQERALALGGGEETLDDRGLADPGLARDEHQPPLTGPGLCEQPLELNELARAACRRLGDGGRNPWRSRPLGRHPWCVCGSAGGVERRVLLEHAPLEIPQRRWRLDPELVVEHAPERLIRIECLCVSPRPIQGEHVLGAEPFAQRMTGDQALQLTDDISMIAKREICLDPPLERRCPKLFQTRALVACEGLRELRQCRPPPERKSLSQ
jgi:hypothetical protein